EGVRAAVVEDAEGRCEGGVSIHEPVCHTCVSLYLLVRSGSSHSPWALVQVIDVPEKPGRKSFRDLGRLVSLMCRSSPCSSLFSRVQVINVPEKTGRKNPRGEFIQLDTQNILFICGGAFVDLEKTIAERKHKSSIGFGAPVRASLRNRSVLDARTAGSLLQSAESTDLIAYGLIPEFVGRFPVLVGLHALTEEQLVQVLLKPKNALSKQFAKLLAMNNARLHMTEGAVRAIARRAAARNTGARGLRSLLEGLLTEAMYEVPSNLVEAVVLDEASMGHEGEEGEEGKPVPSSLVKAVVLDKASVGHEGEEGATG
ncbi:unnamed protein product, partial [Closterium sp. NIES-64]